MVAVVGYCGAWNDNTGSDGTAVGMILVDWSDFAPKDTNSITSFLWFISFSIQERIVVRIVL